MTRDLRPALIATVLLAAAAASWWLARTGGQPALPLLGVTHHEPDYVAHGFNAVTLNADGSRRHTLAARELRHYDDDGSAELDEPYLVQYGDGAPVHTRARRGWLPKDRSYILMTGDVHAARDRDPKAAAADILADSMKIVLAK